MEGLDYLHYVENFILGMISEFLQCKVHKCPLLPHLTQQTLNLNSYREFEPLSRHSKPGYNPRLEVLPNPMASVMMSTYEALPEVRRKQHVGTFEPSTELLDKLRGLLVSSPPTSRRSSSAMVNYPPHPLLRQFPTDAVSS